MFFSISDPWGDTLEYHLNRLSQELQLLEDSFDILPYQLCDRMNYNSQPGKLQYLVLHIVLGN